MLMSISYSTYGYFENVSNSFTDKNLTRNGVNVLCLSPVSPALRKVTDFFQVLKSDFSFFMRYM